MTGYAPAAKRPPLLAYAGTMGAFWALFGGGIALARRRGHELPPRVPAADVLTIGVAAHKLSRILAKDRVTAPLRAPFTELQGPAGPAEVDERARGGGLRGAIGELLVCPFCLGLWIVAALSLGLLVAPRATRFVASAFASLTIADFLQIAYRAAEEKGLH